MKLFIVAVYNLRICIKKDNLGWKYFKGDNSREIISSMGCRGILTVLSHNPSLV